MVNTTRLFLFLTSLILISAWESYEFSASKLSNYEIEETKNDMKSIMQCTDYCLRKSFCQGITFEDLECKLFTNIMESNDNTGLKVLKLNYPRGKLTKLEFKTNAGAHQGTDDDVGVGKVSHLHR